MSIRVQVARDLEGDERNEDRQHQRGEGNRAEARSDEGERDEQTHHGQAEANDRRDDSSCTRTLNKAYAAQIHCSAAAKRTAV